VASFSSTSFSTTAFSPSAFDLAGADVKVSWICFDAAAQPAVTTKSGVSRLWLIEYYTKAFAKPEKKKKKTEPVDLEVVAKAKRISAKKRKEDAEQLERIETAAVKAEQQIEQLTGSMSDAVAAQQFIADILLLAQETQQVVLDFNEIAQKYKRKSQAEDELMLLFALDMVEEKHPPLSDEASELMLLAYAL
jgi:hypothetical protein